jgi:hypothetical protein
MTRSVVFAGVVQLAGLWAYIFDLLSDARRDRGRCGNVDFISSKDKCLPCEF